jgi:hypothetical protein
MTWSKLTEHVAFQQAGNTAVAGTMVGALAIGLFLLSLPGVWIWQLAVLSRDVNKYNQRVAGEVAAIARTVAQPEVRP